MAHRKRPWLAVLLNLAWPGLGHFYLGEDGFGVYLALFTYFGLIVSFPLLFLVLPALWSIAPWLAATWVGILILASFDAYRLALRYNAYGGPSARWAKRVDFVDSANAPVTRTSLRLR